MADYTNKNDHIIINAGKLLQTAVNYILSSIAAMKNPKQEIENFEVLNNFH